MLRTNHLSKKLKAGVVSLGLFCAIIGISWIRPSAPPKNYSSAELFSGLVFHQGPVADLIPEIREKTEVQRALFTDPKQQAEEREMQKLIVNCVSKYNPAFMLEFKSAMTSGDPQKISAEMAKTEDVVIRSLAQYLGISLNDLESAKSQVTRIITANQAKIQLAVNDLESRKITEAQFNETVRSLLVSADPQLAKLSSKASGAFSDQNARLCGCAIALTFAACNVAIAINVAGYFNIALAAAVAVAVAAAVTIKVTLPKTTLPPPTLQPERFASSVARILKATPAEGRLTTGS